MLRKLTILFVLAFFVLVVGWAITPPAQAHWVPGHNHKNCNGGGGDGEENVDPAVLSIINAANRAVTNDGEVEYVDQDLPDGDLCVVAFVRNGGSFWNEMVANCTNPPVPHRTYILRFKSQPACSELGLADNDLNDAFDCILEAQDPDGSGGNARIRVKKLFAKGKNPATPVAFLFEGVNGVNGTSYEVQTDEDAPVVISTNGDTATLTYESTVSLVVIAGIDTRAVVSGFPFRFELMVKRCPDGVCP